MLFHLYYFDSDSIATKAFIILHYFLVRMDACTFISLSLMACRSSFVILIRRREHDALFSPLVFDLVLFRYTINYLLHPIISTSGYIDFSSSSCILVLIFCCMRVWSDCLQKELVFIGFATP